MTPRIHTVRYRVTDILNSFKLDDQVFDESSESCLISMTSTGHQMCSLQLLKACAYTKGIGKPVAYWRALGASDSGPFELR